MGLLDSIFKAYVAPEMEARQQAQYAAGAPGRTAEAWKQMMAGQQQQQPIPGGAPVIPGAQTQQRDYFGRPTGQVAGGQVPQAQPQMSPLDRWKNQISQLVRSGDPTLQKYGLELLSDYHKTATNPPKEKATSTAHKMATEMNFKPGTKPYNDFMNRYAFKSATQINVGGGDKKGSRLSPEEISEWGLDPKLTYAHTDTGPKVISKPSVAAGTAGILSMLETSKKQFPIIENNLMKDGLMDSSVVSAMAAISTTGGLAGPAIGLYDKSIRDRAEASLTAFETGMQAITRTETGAAMNKEEIGNTKQRFMPKPSDGDAVRIQKLKAYKFFINNAIDLLNPRSKENEDLTPQQIMDNAVYSAMANSAGSSIVPGSQPKGSTWVEDGYEYRITEGGKKQRRKLQ